MRHKRLTLAPLLAFVVSLPTVEGAMAHDRGARVAVQPAPPPARLSYGASDLALAGRTRPARACGRPLLASSPWPTRPVYLATSSPYPPDRASRRVADSLLAESAQRPQVMCAECDVLHEKLRIVEEKRQIFSEGLRSLASARAELERNSAIANGIGAAYIILQTLNISFGFATLPCSVPAQWLTTIMAGVGAYVQGDATVDVPLATLVARGGFRGASALGVAGNVLEGWQFLQHYRDSSDSIRALRRNLATVEGAFTTTVQALTREAVSLESDLSRAGCQRNAAAAVEDPLALADFGRLAAALGLNRSTSDDGETPPAADALTSAPHTAPVRITSHRRGERVTSRIIEITGEADSRAGDEIAVQFADVVQTARLVDGVFQSSVVLRSGPNEIRACQGGNCSTITVVADIASLGLMATLAWSGGGDLDLHVETPEGQHCYFSAKSIPGACELDIDDQRGENPENMSIPADGRRGRYRFWVLNYGNSYGSRGTLTLYRAGVLVDSASFVVNVQDGDTVLSRQVTW